MRKSHRWCVVKRRDANCVVSVVLWKMKITKVKWNKNASSWAITKYINQSTFYQLGKNLCEMLQRFNTQRMLSRAITFHFIFQKQIFAFSQIKILIAKNALINNPRTMTTDKRCDKSERAKVNKKTVKKQQNCNCARKEGREHFEPRLKNEHKTVCW